jgi:Htaa
LSRGPTIGLGTIAAALAVVAIALPASAGAASGETKLKLDGPAANALREQGVRVAPVKPASGGNRAISLPVATGLAGSKTTLLRQRGGLALTAPGNRVARLTSLRLLLGKRSLVEAKLGGEEIDLFRVMRGGRRDVDPASGRVHLAGLRLALTPAGAKALAQRLGLESVPAKRIGSLTTRIAGLIRGDSGKPGAGAGGSGGAEKSTACPLPGTAGPPAEGTPVKLARPGSAVDVTAASIRWRVRESFIRYIATGEGTSVSGGASADPPVLLPGASAPLSYDFRFPFANGWIDTGANPESPADDTAALYFSGAVRFHYSGHGIDLLTGSPEIELAGGASRAIFSISDNGGAAERQVLVNLDLGAAGAISQSGTSYTYERVPGAIPSGTASSVFAGFYAPGTDFGCFDVSFSTP